jgi:hypothetical protein
MVVVVVVVVEVFTDSNSLQIKVVRGSHHQSERNKNKWWRLQQSKDNNTCPNYRTANQTMLLQLLMEQGPPALCHLLYQREGPHL